MISGNCFDGAKPPATKVLLYVPVFLNPQPSTCSGETHAVTSTTELRNQTNRASERVLRPQGLGSSARAFLGSVLKTKEQPPDRKSTRDARLGWKASVAMRKGAASRLHWQCFIAKWKRCVDSK